MPADNGTRFRLTLHLTGITYSIYKMQTADMDKADPDESIISRLARNRCPMRLVVVCPYGCILVLRTSTSSNIVPKAAARRVEVPGGATVLCGKRVGHGPTAVAQGLLPKSPGSIHRLIAVRSHAQTMKARTAF